MADAGNGNPSFGLGDLPHLYILSFQFEMEELHELEEQVLALGGNLTYDPKEARVFLGRVAQKKRAAFELRSKGVWTEEYAKESHEPPRKRLRLSSPTGQIVVPRRTTSETESASGTTSPTCSRPTSPLSADRRRHRPTIQMPDLRNRVLVVKLQWIENSIKQNEVLPFEEYLIYDARIIPKPEGASTPTPSSKPITYVKATPETSVSARKPSSVPPSHTISTILSRATAEAPSTLTPGHPVPHQPRRRFNQSTSSFASKTPALTHVLRPPKLHRTTTSEFEDLDSRSLPTPPDWVRTHTMYSCQRSTPLHSPNAAFIAELAKIKEARLLTLDEIGVRAYATSIAAISAYPYPLTSAAEISRLPGCDAKIASLWHDFQSSADDGLERYLPTARALEDDEHLRHLKLFFEIWGVGADTARKFYFDKGWKDMDDVVEFGWTQLNRVQQIGVKYYDEFQVKIPRAEVEGIGDVVLQHANRCRGTDDVIGVIVGGYRRGKDESGDVDIILSHAEDSVTENLVIDVVASLEVEGWVTHTLTLNTTTSDRGQQTLPFRTEGGGHGFDSLDKALCVWQDPVFEGATREKEKKKNTNIHRRVDIIVSSWRTVGCAILGWSGGNTFQRDIRRYVKRAKGWKFDSSGVRDRATGHVLDLESPKRADEGDSWLDREKRLMEGLGIGWRPPSERCTG